MQHNDRGPLSRGADLLIYEDIPREIIIEIYPIRALVVERARVLRNVPKPAFSTTVNQSEDTIIPRVIVAPEGAF